MRTPSMPALPKKVVFPIATGENLHSLHEFELMLSLGQVAFPEPDLVTLGGVTPWLQVAHAVPGAGPSRDYPRCS